jgi:hypothetical protein
MAGSDWTELVFDNKGEMKNPFSITSRDGKIFSLYKGILFVNMPEAIHKLTNGLLKQELCRVYEGTLEIENIAIYAKRGPQRAIFFFINKHGEKGQEEFFAGISCYGWRDVVDEFIKENLHPGEWDGPWEKKDLFPVSKNPKDGMIVEITNLRTKESYRITEPPIEDLWVGVEDFTKKKFVEWINELHNSSDSPEQMTKWLETIGLLKENTEDNLDMPF